jgi:putative sigma-54 modulation protein
VDLIMSIEKFRHIAEVNVHVNGHDFAAKEESDDMYSSIDKSTKDLERQMKKIKGKRILNTHKHRKGAAKVAARETVIGSGSVGSATGLEIIEDISHQISELTVEEAIVAMEDGERNFMLFNNKESGTLNLVYRRADGNYGLIDKL